jgi:hypothetical protein
MSVVSSPLGWARSQAAAYRHGADRPLGGYLAVLGIYGSGTLAASGLARLLGRTPPERLSPWDVVQLTLATHKVARVIAKDPITSPFRVPFTEYQGSSAPAELTEEVRAHDQFGHAAGELLTCPMCLGQWVATAFVLGLIIAPRPTRLALATFSAVAGADFLQYVYVSMQQSTEDDDQ